jgi:kinesin family member 5
MSPAPGLQDCLGGNSRTALIINVSPSSANEDETRSSLRFGATASQVVMHVAPAALLPPSVLAHKASGLMGNGGRGW